MKVRFENAEIDLWKIKKGVVVMKGSTACHISEIGLVWDRNGDTVLNIRTKGITDEYIWGQDHISNDLTWIEPH